MSKNKKQNTTHFAIERPCSYLKYKNHGSQFINEDSPVSTYMILVNNTGNQSCNCFLKTPLTFNVLSNHMCTNLSFLFKLPDSLLFVSSCFDLIFDLAFDFVFFGGGGSPASSWKSSLKTRKQNMNMKSYFLSPQIPTTPCQINVVVYFM